MPSARARRTLATQQRRKDEAKADPGAQLVAAGRDAFNQLAADVGAVLGRDPLQSEDGVLAVSTAWSLVHGAADLLIGGRLPISWGDAARTHRLAADLVARGMRHLGGMGG